MSLEISSPAFSSGTTIPARYTCSGADVSPPLAWRNVPATAKCLAIICEDPDAPGGTFYHWGIYGLPTTLTSLAEGVDTISMPKGAKVVHNSFGSADYRGPCPPSGHGTHHYHFRLFALSTPNLTIGKGADCQGLLASLRPHVVATAEVVGTFAR
jgi:Raf kinase inhibitor-like YbhB/YbcL family protein